MLEVSSAREEKISEEAKRRTKKRWIRLIVSLVIFVVLDFFSMIAGYDIMSGDTEIEIIIQSRILRQKCESNLHFGVN